VTFLAIDPGRDTGWAVLREDGILSSCGLGDPPLAFNGHRVLVERPQIYRGRASKADPNDLITLAIQVGRYKERFMSRGCSVEEIIPHTWKGTVDPDVLCNRIVSSLTDDERCVLDSALLSVAKSKQHNVIDAVGLGKWSVHRSRAAVFHVFSSRQALASSRDG